MSEGKGKGVVHTARQTIRFAECEHTIDFNFSPPLPGDVVLCFRCDEYQTVLGASTLRR